MKLIDNSRCYIERGMQNFAFFHRNYRNHYYTSHFIKKFYNKFYSTKISTADMQVNNRTYEVNSDFSPCNFFTCNKNFFFC
jgi:hypothetical protein